MYYHSYRAFKKRETRRCCAALSYILQSCASNCWHILLPIELVTHSNKYSLGKLFHSDSVNKLGAFVMQCKGHCANRHFLRSVVLKCTAYVTHKSVRCVSAYTTMRDLRLLLGSLFGIEPVRARSSVFFANLIMTCLYTLSHEQKSTCYSAATDLQLSAVYTTARRSVHHCSGNRTVVRLLLQFIGLLLALRSFNNYCSLYWLKRNILEQDFLRIS